MAWEWLKRLGKARYQTVGLGAGKTIQSDLAQKKAMEILSPMVGEALDKLGDKVAGQQGGFLPLVVLGELTPGLVQQLGASCLTYQSSTESYEEDGLFPLLRGLRSLILGFVWQLGAGRLTYKSGKKPCQEGCLFSLLGGLSGLILKLAKQLGAGRKKKCHTPITGSSIMTPTLRRPPFCRQGGCNVRVLPETISRHQVGIGPGCWHLHRPMGHCFQGLP